MAIQDLPTLRLRLADAELAKMKVVQVYRDNVIDMARAVGAALAERCFPQVRSSRRKNEA